MKINQSAISTQPKMPARENSEKADALTKNSDDTQKIAESGVTLTVSQRNSVDISQNGESEQPVGGIKALLGKLLESPESTATAHSGLTPEKVLQLIS